METRMRKSACWDRLFHYYPFTMIYWWYLGGVLKCLKKWFEGETGDSVFQKVKSEMHQFPLFWSHYAACFVSSLRSQDGMRLINLVTVFYKFSEKFFVSKSLNQTIGSKMVLFKDLEDEKMTEITVVPRYRWFPRNPLLYLCFIARCMGDVFFLVHLDSRNRDIPSSVWRWEDLVSENPWA